MTVLPLTVGDFQLLEEYRMVEKDGNPVEYRLFTYENKENGWTVRAIFNPESEEYAVRVDIGMLEFALSNLLPDPLTPSARWWKSDWPGSFIIPMWIERKTSASS